MFQARTEGKKCCNADLQLIAQTPNHQNTKIPPLNLTFNLN